MEKDCQAISGLANRRRWLVKAEGETIFGRGLVSIGCGTAAARNGPEEQAGETEAYQQ
jgi:hypothetical protein